MVSDRLYQRFYPDASKDGTLYFYNWVRRYTRPDTRLLNLGAGPATGAPLRRFRGEVAYVVGADIDPVVFDNDELDHAVLIEDGRLPLPDADFDVIVSDYVFEHVEQPVAFLAEAHRVLKPGGSCFFRTPTKFHYVTLIARLTPHWFHVLVANRLRGMAEDAHEPWPTWYRLNAPSRVRQVASEVGFGEFEFVRYEANPSYMVFAAPAFLLGVAYERLVNRFESLGPFRANIFGRLER